MIKSYQVAVPATATRLSALITGLPAGGTAILLQSPDTNAAAIYFGEDGAQFGILGIDKSISLPMTKYGLLNIKGNVGDDLHITIVN